MLTFSRKIPAREAMRSRQAAMRDAANSGFSASDHGFQPEADTVTVVVALAAFRKKQTCHRSYLNAEYRP